MAGRQCSQVGRGVQRKASRLPCKESGSCPAASPCRNRIAGKCLRTASLVPRSQEEPFPKTLPHMPEKLQG